MSNIWRSQRTTRNTSIKSRDAQDPVPILITGPPLLRRFRPQVLVSQHGADTHRLDPLARLELSIDAQRAAHAAIHALAHDLAGGRWLLTGGGGYELVQVVPRTWTHLLAEAAGQPIADRPADAHARPVA